MGKLDDLGLASNERRNQNIMLLRQNFNDEKYNTLADVVSSTGYTLPTVTRWALDGNIPLLDDHGQPVVAITDDNARQINVKNRSKHINDLCELYYDQKATTVTACMAKMGYPVATIIAWAIQGDIPLINSEGTPLVPLNDTNTPVWFDLDY